jgi:hypothetical protein
MLEDPPRYGPKFIHYFSFIISMDSCDRIIGFIYQSYAASDHGYSLEDLVLKMNPNPISQEKIEMFANYVTEFEEIRNWNERAKFLFHELFQTVPGMNNNQEMIIYSKAFLTKFTKESVIIMNQNMKFEEKMIDENINFD